MLPRSRVNAPCGHPAEGVWHQLFWPARAARQTSRAAPVCYNPPTTKEADLSSAGLSGRPRRPLLDIKSGMEKSSVLRRFFVAALLAALAVAPAAAQAPAAGAQDKDKKEQARPAEDARQGKGKTYTAEQIAETVVLVYGSRQGMAQVRRTGVERGTITRTAEDGRSESIPYSRTFKRGDTYEKDKIRLDQRLPSVEYSLVYADGKVTGLLRGTPFTPKEADVTTIMSDRVHGLDALLRYKETGATVKFVGNESQKGLEMWVLELSDKGGNSTRYYISSKSGRVLWLEYEQQTAAGAPPTKFKRTFHDYRVVQGTLVPYRTVLYEGDRKVEESQVLTVTYGVKTEDSVFLGSESATFQP
jgi:hypothetical protein